MIRPENEHIGVINGYFFEERLLLRKWACVVKEVQVDKVVQVVVPSKFTDLAHHMMELQIVRGKENL